MTTLHTHTANDAAPPSEPVADESTGTDRNRGRGRSRWPTRIRNGSTGRSGRGRLIAVAAVLSALLMLAHARVPNAWGNVGSLFETFLPWLGVSVPLLLILALARRSAIAMGAVLIPAVVWSSLFGVTLTDKSAGGGDLTVVGHNVHDENPDPKGTAQRRRGSLTSRLHWIT